MRDWGKFVEAQLSGLALPPGTKADVVDELVGHLEETYEALRNEGISDEDAARRILAQVIDWKKLRRGIQNARQKEHTMNTRVARFWLPSLLTLILAMSIPALLAKSGIESKFPWQRSSELRTYIFTVYGIWLLALPLIGALGAYVSKRAGGTRGAMILSGIFPALALSAVIIFVIPYTMFLEQGFRAATRLLGIFGLLAFWAVIPGLSLLAGVFLFEAASRRREMQPAR